MTSIVSTSIVALILAGIVFLIVRKMIADKKAGKHSCGGNCGSCGMCRGEFKIPPMASEDKRRNNSLQ